MQTVILDGAQIPTREALHDTLAQQLCLPVWYGKNLDALFDCLTDFQTPVAITLLHADVLQTHLGGYAQALLRVLQLAAQENRAVSFQMQP